MHEMGIVVELARTLDNLAEEQNINKISSVTMEIGKASGIIKQFFETCWDYVSEEYSVINGAKLIIHMMPATTYCENCEKTYDTFKYGKTCPYCGSGETYLIDGSDCIIKEIEAEVPEDYEVEADGTLN